MNAKYYDYSGTWFFKIGIKLIITMCIYIVSPNLVEIVSLPFEKCCKYNILIIDVAPAKEKCSKSTWTKNWLGLNSTPACNTPNVSARFSSACSISPECLSCSTSIFWVSCSLTGRRNTSFALITQNPSNSMNKSTTVCYFYFSRYG